MNWIDKIIESYVRERGFVITASVILFLAGIWAYSELNILNRIVTAFALSAVVQGILKTISLLYKVVSYAIE